MATRTNAQTIAFFAKTTDSFDNPENRLPRDTTDALRGGNVRSLAKDEANEPRLAGMAVDGPNFCKLASVIARLRCPPVEASGI
mmetsp:Transcript_6819/g.21126  ORF Transcript_6819/g.21126 Transcript_6819/m.21126 type:complete len:84 (+) Transcript_6819:187-438(+)